jgi:hypothetical protein
MAAVRGHARRCSPREPGLSARWVAEDPVTVEVDRSTLPDPEDGKPLTAVVVRMPAYFAEYLAQVLGAWTDVGELMRDLSADERALAEALRLGAQAARRRDEASHESLLQRMRDLLAEHRMAVRQWERDERSDDEA